MGKSKKEKSLGERLLAAIEMIQKPSSGAPADMWHPKYGWIIKDGEGTKEGAKFYKDCLRKKKND